MTTIVSVRRGDQVVVAGDGQHGGGHGGHRGLGSDHCVDLGQERSGIDDSLVNTEAVAVRGDKAC